MAHFTIAWGSLLLCTTFALVAGGTPERLAGTVMLLGSIVTEFALSPMHGRYDRFEWGGFLVDAAVLLLFVALALRANRFWPMWIAAMQAVAIVGYFLALADYRPLNLLSALLTEMWIYPMLAVLVIGTGRHRWRARRYGDDRAWSDEFRPA